MEILIIFILFILLSFASIPIAISMGITVFALCLLTGTPLSIIPQMAFTSLNKFAYIAVPLFILVGNLMETGGLSKRIVQFSSSLLLKMPGSLGSINILSCTFFGAISGSASATTAAIGGMLVPEMTERNYPKGYSGALSAVSGTLGAMIPPSIVMIIYAITAEISVADMFLAGFLPGVILALGLIIVNTIFAVVKKVDIQKDGQKFNWKRVGSTLWHAKWALLSLILVLGGIYTGVFTATEAAVIATVYSLIVGLFIHRELQFKDLFAIFTKTVKTVGSVIIIVPFASILGRLLTLNQVPQRIGDWALTVTNNSSVMMLLFVCLITISGMFMDATPLILIFTPLFLPILMNMGISAIHFGIILTLGAMLGAVTPPVGVNLFIGQAISKAKTIDIMKYAFFLIGVFLVIYIIITVNPWISDVVVNMSKNLQGR